MDGKDLILASKKVLRYRRHLLPSAVISEIELGMSEVRDSLRLKNFSNLQMRIRNLDFVLEKHGGNIFPLKFLSDNTEVLFVATLLAIAIRTFFIQSFQIPTNSMYPTFHGMTHKIVMEVKQPLNFWQKLINKIRFWAGEVDVVARNTGEILIPLTRAKFATTDEIHHIIPYEVVSVKKWHGLRTVKVRKYKFFVDDEEYAILTPLEFPLDKVFLEKFCNNDGTWERIVTRNKFTFINDQRMELFKVGRFAEAGKSIIHFGILTGDMLFVEKMTYHFRPPAIGESVIFRTENIEAFESTPKFFIKRLVGKCGDVLEIRDNKLFINGSFPKNETIEKLNSRANGYENGYQSAGLLEAGREIKVPEGQYFVLGDNSSDSYDSRFWGFVPQKSVCGRPLVIFYPFGCRFGKTK
jgi:signal peptidase I